MFAVSCLRPSCRPIKLLRFPDFAHPNKSVLKYMALVGCAGLFLRFWRNVARVACGSSSSNTQSCPCTTTHDVSNFTTTPPLPQMAYGAVLVLPAQSARLCCTCKHTARPLYHRLFSASACKCLQCPVYAHPVGRLNCCDFLISPIRTNLC